MYDEFIINKKLDLEKIKTNLEEIDDRFIYKTEILDDFLLSILIDINGSIESLLIDKNTNEEYTLYKTKAKGKFLALIKERIEKVVKDLVGTYYIDDLFCSKQCVKLLDYVYLKYNVCLELLWKDNDYGVLRESKSKKWFAVLMRISKDKLGSASKELIDVINLKVDDISIVDHIHIFPAYHMNKKHWISILIDEKMDLDMLTNLIDRSYNLVQ